MNCKFEFLENEFWWGGSAIRGCENPFTKKSNIEEDFRKVARNQTMPLYLSNKGRYIWSDSPFKVCIKNGVFYFEGENVILKNAGKTLKEAYLAAMREHFPFDGKRLPREFFETAQYNTWMEFTYNPTQKGVLEYARAIINNGFKPGIFIIDEGWHGRYGTWEFDFAKFPKPKDMIDELHSMGFKVMLWVVPMVCPDGQKFIMDISSHLNNDGKTDKRFIRNADGEVGLFKWWNGYSAMLDFTNPIDCEFLDSQLKYLTEHYGVDGFKFDGGPIEMYSPDNMINGPAGEDMDPVALNAAWNEFGRRYKFHEYKDTYNGGGKNCIQRLCDRGHQWEPEGINTIVPCSIMQGLLGHPFICPDMIGGGEWSYTVNPDLQIDGELFVRMAQVSALCPMMQFSWAPWKALDSRRLDIVLAAARLHEKMSGEIIELIEESEVSGEPVLRNLEYNDPHNGYEEIKDEFMLGENILAAPVVTPKTYRRKVVFPQGTWQDEDGNLYEGRTERMLETPEEKLLWFRKVK